MPSRVSLPRPLLIVASLVTLASFPRMLSAQSTVVRYGAAGPGADGFSSASVGVVYRLMSCGGELWLTAATTPSTLSVSATYYHNGKSYPAPDVRSDAGDGMDLSADVFQRTPQGSRRIGSATFAIGSSFVGDCYNARDFVTIGTMSSYLGADATSTDRKEFLNSLYMQGSARAPLRSVAVEQAIESQIYARKQADEAREAAQAKAAADAKAEADERVAAAARKRAAAEAAAAARTAERKAESDAATRTAAARAAQTTRASGTSAAGGTRSNAAKTVKRETEYDRAEAARLAQQRASSDAAREASIDAVAQAVADAVVQKWEAAERAYNQGDYTTAQPIYQELASYQNYYQTAAQQRVDAIKAKNYAEMAQMAMAAGDAVGGAVVSMASDISSTMDGLGIAHYNGTFLSYDGLASVNGAFPADKKPASIMLGWGTYRAFDLEARAGYTRLPTVAYRIHDKNYNNDPATMAVDGGGATVGLSMGFSAPFQRVVPYALAGVDMMFPGLTGDGGSSYKADLSMDALEVYKGTVGVNFRLSNSQGVGVGYTWSSFSPIDLSSSTVTGPIADHRYSLIPVNSGVSFSSFRLQYFFSMGGTK